MQAGPIKPKLKPPGTKRLILNCDVLLPTSAFKFNLRRYIPVYFTIQAKDEFGNNLVKSPEPPSAQRGYFDVKVGRCRLTLSNPS